MKAYWHTKTLFIEWGKYKWARKHDFCTSCLSAKKPHKWNWLCIACHDKQRAKNRKWALRKQQVKHYYKNRLLYILTTVSNPRKKPWQKPKGFNKIEYRKQWYRKNKKAILLYRKEWYRKNKKVMLLKWEVQRRRKKWLPCLEMRINWETKYFPFEWIEKPSQASINTRTYREYEKLKEKYDLLYNWYKFRWP